MESMAKRKKPGRKPKGPYGRTITLAVKVSQLELAAWKKAAKAEKSPLGPWLLKPRRDKLPASKR